MGGVAHDVVPPHLIVGHLAALVLVHGVEDRPHGRCVGVDVGGRLRWRWKREREGGGSRDGEEEMGKEVEGRKDVPIRQGQPTRTKSNKGQGYKWQVISGTRVSKCKQIASDSK